MSTIKLRRSGVAGKKPTTAQLDLGEVAINTVDGRLYIKKSVNSVESIVGFMGTPFSESNITLDTFTGDGTTTTFTLSREPLTEQHMFITINGVAQAVDAYSYSGTTLTLSEAPLSTDEIEVRIHDNTTTTVQIRDYKKYVYTVTNATAISGNDDTGESLLYDVGFVEVYVNGSRLVDGSDFTATNGTSITIQEAVTGTVEVISLSRATFVDSKGGLPLTATSQEIGTGGAGSAEEVDSFYASAYRSAKYIVQMSDGTDHHVTEVLLIHDGTDVYMTEYGTIYTNSSMGSIDASIVSGRVVVTVTPTNINTTVNTQRITVMV